MPQTNGALPQYRAMIRVWSDTKFANHSDFWKEPNLKKCDPTPLSPCKWFGFQCMLYIDSDINDKSQFITDGFLRYIPS